MRVKQRRRPRALRPRPNRPEQILAAACRAIRRGAEAGEFSPVSDPDELAERLLAQVDGLGFELLLGYSWTSPERMRERLYGFAAEQLGIERRALERDARAAIAVLDGDGT
jgi:hypothetical protein